jgi:molecular chaperone HtpG
VTDHRFQVDLRGIIELLSRHLYSTPGVYVRELLQNAVDAIRARGEEGDRRISLRLGRSDLGTPSLEIEDRGIGLGLDDVHRFLATIGASTKRGAERSDFIGQFGIGLLSAFVVSSDISVVTRARGGPVVRWRGRSDGTYTVETADDEAIAPGTLVHLSAKPDMAEWFDPDRVTDLAKKFGALLPYPIELEHDGTTRTLNDEPPPWRRTFASPADERAACLAFGAQLLGSSQFLDVFRLRTEAGGVEGLAYVLPFPPSPTALPSHRVYLKGMLVSEHAENLLPRWAVFVTCILDASELTPTASRETFYDDEVLARVRAEIGHALRAYLAELKTGEPRLLETFVNLHHRSLKAIAAYDDEFLDLFLDVLPFETTMGRISFEEIRRRSEIVRFAPTVEVFRQIAQIAAAQGLPIVNAGYSYEVDILTRVSLVRPDVEIDQVDASDVASRLEEPSPSEASSLGALVRAAQAVLAPYRCAPELRRFSPEELPVLFVSDADTALARAVGAGRTVQEDESAWKGLLESLESELRSARASLIFNARNPLVRRLAAVGDDELLKLAVQMLYVQALLLGHHPLGPAEVSLLNVSLLDFLAWGLERSEGERQLQ